MIRNFNQILKQAQQQFQKIAVNSFSYLLQYGSIGRTASQSFWKRDTNINSITWECNISQYHSLLPGIMTQFLTVPHIGQVDSKRHHMLKKLIQPQTIFNIFAPLVKRKKTKQMMCWQLNTYYIHELYIWGGNSKGAYLWIQQF